MTLAQQTERDINPNRSLDRICLDLLLPSCFLPALVRLPASALSLHLDVARYAFDETSAHLLNNRTKSVKDSNDRFGIKTSGRCVRPDEKLISVYFRIIFRPPTMQTPAGNRWRAASCRRRWSYRADQWCRSESLYFRLP